MLNNNTQIVNTRIKNKIDTPENWEAVNPVLLPGEIAFVKMPVIVSGSGTELAILMKVGDGERAFKELPYASARASDVHDWAKAVDPSEVPVKVNEKVEGLATWLNTILEESGNHEAALEKIRSLFIADPDDVNSPAETDSTLLSVAETVTLKLKELLKVQTEQVDANYDSVITDICVYEEADKTGILGLIKKPISVEMLPNLSKAKISFAGGEATILENVLVSLIENIKDNDISITDIKYILEVLQKSLDENFSNILSFNKESFILDKNDVKNIPVAPNANEEIFLVHDIASKTMKQVKLASADDKTAGIVKLITKESSVGIENDVDTVAVSPSYVQNLIDALEIDDVKATLDSLDSLLTTASCPVTLNCGGRWSAHDTGETVVNISNSPTCTADGVSTSTIYCSCCTPKAVLSRVETAIPALGHTEGEVVVENNIAPNCINKGSYDNVVYCTVCGDEVSRETIVVPALGHNYTESTRENEVAPTCTVDGSYDESRRCDVCGHTETEKVTVPATGHTPGAVQVEENNKPTCTNPGSYDSVTYCTVCKAEMSRITTDVPALGHTPAEAVKENIVEATCTEAGSYDEVIYCTICGEELERTTITVDALGHTEGEVVVENEVAATCTTDGKYDTVVYCSVCDAELSRIETIVPKTGHTPAAAVEENRVESTCTVAGSYDSVVYCSVCNAELSRETKELELADHTPGEWIITKYAEVGVEGEKVCYCTVCNKVAMTEIIPALTRGLKVTEGSSVIIDRERGFIYNVPELVTDLEGLVECEGGTINYVETTAGFGTGSEVEILDDQGEIIETFKIVIFGDLTGDGAIDALDYARLMAHIDNENTFEKDSAYEFAADINHDGVINDEDLTSLEKIFNGEE